MIPIPILAALCILAVVSFVVSCIMVSSGTVDEGEELDRFFRGLSTFISGCAIMLAIANAKTQDKMDVLNDTVTQLQTEKERTVEVAEIRAKGYVNVIEDLKKQLDLTEAQVSMMKQGRYPSGELTTEDVVLRLYNEGKINDKLFLAYLTKTYETR